MVKKRVARTHKEIMAEIRAEKKAKEALWKRTQTGFRLPVRERVSVYACDCGGRVLRSPTLDEQDHGFLYYSPDDIC